MRKVAAILSLPIIIIGCIGLSVIFAIMYWKITEWDGDYAFLELHKMKRI